MTCAGFQVHEKSILLPLLPAAMLSRHEPRLLRLFAFLAAFSCFPLLRRDLLTAAYAGCLILYFCLGLDGLRGGVLRRGPERPVVMEPRVDRLLAVWERAVWICAAGLHVVSAQQVQLYRHLCCWSSQIYTPHLQAYLIPAPQRLPHLHAAAVTAFCGLNFTATALYMNIRHALLHRRSGVNYNFGTRKPPPALRGHARQSYKPKTRARRRQWRVAGAPESFVPDAAAAPHQHKWHLS